MRENGTFSAFMRLNEKEGESPVNPLFISIQE
jgi:hypothetical protein